MPKITYIDKTFRSEALEIIDKANDIIEKYQADGFDLTLRQLYYQFVARNIFKNIEKNYTKLSSIISNARLAGLVDWKAIVDRTRELKDLAHWTDAAEIIEQTIKQYRRDKWAWQPFRIEVWIEKDALTGVIEKVCKKYDVPYFSCRGYVSQSEMWVASQRIVEHQVHGTQKYHILHLGDHDPSGIDMTRDIRDRLELFVGQYIELHRLALNMDQIEQYNPPPNPAKLKDTRCADYIKKYGSSSWELDALEPSVMSNLIEEKILEIRYEDKWAAAEKEEAKEKDKLTKILDTLREG